MENNIVIIGGGVIGAACAYFTSAHPSFKSSGRKIILLEATELAGGASGKAGGLLATWAFPSCIVPLSFRLHAELADKFNGAERWGYRVLDGCWNVVGDAGNGKVKASRNTKIPQGLDWVDGLNALTVESMAEKGETAQVHPKLLTHALVEEAIKNGVEMVYGKATDILTVHDPDGKHDVCGVKYSPSKTSEDQLTLAASTVIVTAGPWASSLLPKAPISTIRAHSVVIKPTTLVPGHCLFTNISLKAPNSRRHITATPEIYPRPDGSVYACGEGDSLINLPLTSADVAVDQKRVDEVLEHVGAASTALKNGEVLARQACYLPNVDSRSSRSGSSGPLIGLTSTKGLIIAAGHTCWGIQNSVGTGCLVSEILWEGSAKSAKIDELDPRGWDL